jgi:NAD(P)-dependent dehydrogenase (short-subunit alcohol dehydrogenase family)
MVELTGKVVVVTGAGGGLGSVVVRKYLQAGAIVAAVDRSWPNETPETERLLQLSADLGTYEGARYVVDEALKLSGRIDALAHIAGGFAAGGTGPDDGDNTWEKMIHLNLTLAHNVIRAVLPVMMENRGGRIVAVGSRAGLEPVSGLAAYCASKAAMLMLIRCIAEEGKAAGVTANAVLPSTIDTPGNRAAMPEADHSAWVRPEAIADQILWLTSTESADVSGALLPVYGRA